LAVHFKFQPHRLITHARRNLAAKIKHYLDGLPTGGQPVPANEAADETCRSTLKHTRDEFYMRLTWSQANFALPSATAHQFPTSHEMGMPMGPVGGISPPFYIQPDDNWVNNGVDESAMQGIEYHGTGAAVEGHFGGYGSDMHCGSNVWDADGPDNVAMLSSSCTSSGSVRSEHSVTTISSQRSEPRDGAVLEKMQAILELVNRLQEKHSSIDVGVMLPLGRKDPIQEAAGSYQQIIDLLQADVDDYTKEAPLIADEDEICPQRELQLPFPMSCAISNNTKYSAHRYLREAHENRFSRKG